MVESRPSRHRNDSYVGKHPALIATDSPAAQHQQRNNLQKGCCTNLLRAIEAMYPGVTLRLTGSSSICVLLGWANGQHACPQ
jgi:hypothetical protein